MKTFNARNFTALALVWLLNACGGGSGDDGVPVSGRLSVDCNGCAATDATTYAGSGIGVWSYQNMSSEVMTVPVVLKGLNGNTVTLVVTNMSDAAFSTPASVSVGTGLHANMVKGAPSREAQAIAEFNRSGWASLTRRNALAGAPKFAATKQAAGYSIGDARVFNVGNGNTSARQTTLMRTATVSGRTVNLWVENGEYTSDKITQSMLDALFAAYTKSGGIYESVTELAGPPWGGHGYSTYISGSDQPVDIVLANLTPDSSPSGMIGYFYALNLFSKSFKANSNESVSLYLDTEALYLGGDSALQTVLSTLTHESTHMANFYRQAVSRGPEYVYDTWLEEASAMMMEDVLATRLGIGNPAQRHLDDYLSFQNFACGIVDFDTITTSRGTCIGYDQVGSFGAYLLRQHGVDLFKSILVGPSAGESSKNFVDRLLTAINQRGFWDQIQRFQTGSIAALSPDKSLPLYGYPSRIDGAYELQQLDPSGAFLDLSSQLFDGTSLRPGGATAARLPNVSTLNLSISVPANAKLSVVVSD